MARSKYEEKVAPKLDLILGWARDGLTLDDIAFNLGITRQTLSKYASEKNKDGSFKHELLHQYLKEGREVADYRVENALYKAATGYYTLEKKYMRVGDELEEVEEEVYHPPSVTAQIFWLKNRKPDVWRDKIAEQEVTEDITDVLMISQKEVQDEKNPSSVEATAEASSVSGKE